ncbi:hypothetical protein IWZ01DRAFT_76130 [Phyllosticta capitalensis]
MTQSHLLPPPSFFTTRTRRRRRRRKKKTFPPITLYFARSEKKKRSEKRGPSPSKNKRRRAGKTVPIITIPLPTLLSLEHLCEKNEEQKRKSVVEPEPRQRRQGVIIPPCTYSLKDREQRAPVIAQSGIQEHKQTVESIERCSNKGKKTRSLQKRICNERQPGRKWAEGYMMQSR